MSKILLVEDEEELRELLQANLEGVLKVEVLEAEGGHEAQRLLEQYSNEIALVVSDYKMPNGNGGELYKFLQEKGLDIPFVLMSTFAPSDCPEIGNSPVFGFVEKPSISKKLLALAEKALERFASREQQTHFRIRKKLVTQLNSFSCDLYIKLGNNHFVKFLAKNQKIDNEIATKIEDKNIDYFYCPVEQSADFQKSYTALLLKHLHSIQSLKDAANVFGQNIEVLHEIQSKFGWSEDVLEITAASIQIVQETFKSFPEFKKVLEQLEESNTTHYLYKHSSVLALTCAGLLELTQQFTPENLAAVVTAALFHDMHMTEELMDNIDEIYKNSKNKTFDRYQYMKDYKSHPEKAADSLAQLPNVDPLTVVIVQQHHEEPDGTGIPSGLMGPDIDPMAALFIIGQRLADFTIHKTQVQPYNAFFVQNKNLYKEGSFSDILLLLERSLIE